MSYIKLFLNNPSILKHSFYQNLVNLIKEKHSNTDLTIILGRHKPVIEVNGAKYTYDIGIEEVDKLLNNS